MSNYWGMLKGAGVIVGQMPQTTPILAAVAANAQANVCGDNFAADVSTNLQGDNNAYVLSATRKAGCDALTDIDTGAVWNTSAVGSADTLTVRRTSVFPAIQTPAGQLKVCTSRVAGRLVSDGTGGACTAALTNNYAACPCDNNVMMLSNLIVNTYYVDRNSAQQAGLPSLRRKTLTAAGGVPQFRDQEIIPGVEDLQIQFGIDPLGNTGVATRYVNPNGVPVGAQIVAVRIWLLVRSDTGETGFTDNRVYSYGDRLVATGTTGDITVVGAAGMAYQPSANADATINGPQHVRRLLVSRTIQVRNALGT
jgi:type IV pilus assembly protein PilW